MDPMSSREAPRVCVIGAGVTGLSTAVRLQQLSPSRRVCLYADKVGTETVSDIAGGLCVIRRTLEISDDPNHEKAVYVAKASFDYWRSLVDSVEGVKAGVMRTSGYDIFLPGDAYSADFAKIASYRYDEMSPEFVGKIFPELPQSTRGYSVTTVITDQSRYMPYLMEKFLAGGGQLIRRRINEISELFDTHDVVVNCSGWDEDRPLLRDPHAFPCRGAILRMKAPSLREFVYFSDGTDRPPYIIPRLDDVVVGGVKQDGVSSMGVTDEDRRIILQKVSRLTPYLKSAEIISEHGAARPSRSEIRLEKVKVIHRGQPKFIVHNYGHGGIGVSISWGSAVIAADYTEQAVTEIVKLSAHILSKM